MQALQLALLSNSTPTTDSGRKVVLTHPNRVSTKTGINEPVSGDEAPEKLSRFAEGLPTLLETLSVHWT